MRAQSSSGARRLMFGRTLVYFHTSCMRTAKALPRLRGCEPARVAYVISTIISWAGSFIDLNQTLKIYQIQGWRLTVWPRWPPRRPPCPYNVMSFEDLCSAISVATDRSSVVVLVWFLFYGPSTHFRSFRARSVTITKLFLGSLPVLSQ